ncbi:MAG: exodeoxyribonuclease VII large subunit [Clostridia bacterium]|nr:exodeoxyribonuclease VII large subunit [Clostridia bacterium]
MLTYTVNDLNTHIKRLFEYEHSLKNIKVRGEVSNLSVSSAGHLYFTLKDEDASVRCVWFGVGQDVLFKNADNIIVTASVSLYVRGGDYQLNVSDAEYSGIGYWYEKFHQIKTKLEKEGLFDDIHKRKLPLFPQKVGVITSETGAAIKDVVRVVEERYPICEVLHYPVMVQGAGASKTIAAAIDYMSENNLCDVIILTRGGGSQEDLWEFNEEIVARAIFNCKIPIISAVGHERDISICDYTADVRESTPSTAAARAVPDADELRSILSGHLYSLNVLIEQKIDALKSSLEKSRLRLSAVSPTNRLNEYSQRLDYMQQKMSVLIEKTLISKQNRISLCESALSPLHPLLPLEKGYMIAMDEDDNIINTTEQILRLRKARLKAKDGTIGIIPIDKEKVE